MGDKVYNFVLLYVEMVGRMAMKNVMTIILEILMVAVVNVKSKMDGFVQVVHLSKKVHVPKKGHLNQKLK